MKRHLLSGLALAVALTAASAGPAAAQYYGQYQHDSRSTTGTIAVVNGSNIRLSDGRNIFLKDGTVINPRGARLQPGMEIAVQGWRGGNGAINASNIQVVGWHGHNGYYHHDDDNGYNH